MRATIFGRGPRPVHGLSFLWLLIAACGGSATISAADTTTADAVEIAPTPPEPEPTDYLPADTFALVTVDVARLRSSPYYPMVVEAVKSTDEMRSEEEEVLHQLVERTSKVWFAGVPHPRREGADLGCILVEGDYDPGQVEAALQTFLSESERAHLEEIEIAGHRVLGGGAGMLAELDARHWLMGPPERVRSLLESPPGGFAAMNDPAWAEAQQWLQRPSAGINLLALGTPELRLELARETPMDSEAAGHVRSVAFSLDADDGLFVEAMALMDDPAVAAAIIQWIETGLDELAGSMIAGMLGLQAVIEAVDARAEGTVAGVRLQVPDAEVRRLLGILPNLLNQ